MMDVKFEVELRPDSAQFWSDAAGAPGQPVYDDRQLFYDEVSSMIGQLEPGELQVVFDGIEEIRAEQKADVYVYALAEGQEHPRYTVSRDTLAEAVQTLHLDHPCSHCPKGFADAKGLRNHHNARHDTKICPECDLVVHGGHINFRKHCRDAHDSKPSNIRAKHGQAKGKNLPKKRKR